jgi:hypothetical protein
MAATGAPLFHCILACEFAPVTVNTTVAGVSAQWLRTGFAASR